MTADGATWPTVADLDAKFPGLKDRVVDDAGLRRFVNVYPQRRGCAVPRRPGNSLSDGDSVTIPAGGCWRLILRFPNLLAQSATLRSWAFHG